MISKNQLKFLHSLKLKKFRDINRVFTVEGVKMVDELLASHYRIVEIFGTSDWLSIHREVLITQKIRHWEITGTELAKASNLVTPNEVIAVVAFPEPIIQESSGWGRIILVLDKIQDPGNLGTIIRTADWFGIRHIFASENTADLFNPKVIQATMGSVFRVSLHYTDISHLIREELNGWHTFAATATGESIYSSEIRFPAALVIGNESQGISEEILLKTSRKIAIPSYSVGAESLNASVAAGILCAEFARRLNHGG